MSHAFGPWATPIDIGQSPQLSTFWRRRLAMLVPVSYTRCELSRPQVLSLATAALVVCLVPTWRALPVLAQQPNPAQEDRKENQATAGQSPSKQTAGATTGSTALDPNVKALGEAVRKRILAALPDSQTTETMLLKDGQAGLMKVKKNATPVAQVRITPYIVGKGTRFDVEGLDAAGKTIEGCRTTSSSIQNSQCLSLGKTFAVGGQEILPVIQLQATHQEGNRVTVMVTVRIDALPTMAEVDAVLLSMGTVGQVQLDFKAINTWIWEYRQQEGHYPQTLAELKKPLPKDRYSPTGADYHYQRQRTRYILSSCGKDGIYGTADDDVCVYGPAEVSHGERREVYPLEEEKDAPSDDENDARTSTHKPPFEPPPWGNCSISGQVVSAATGKPVAGASMYLFYVPTFSAVFVTAAGDGTFQFKNLPRGPLFLQSSHTSGYQDIAYNPAGTPGPLPEFSLADGEHRTGIVLRAKPACSVSGRILGENGHMPEHIESLAVLAWFKSDYGERYESAQAMMVNQTDGSYLIDGLGEKPVYVMAINWRAAQRGNASPPIYYPGVFSRSDAKLLTFDKARTVAHVDITLRKEGGLVLEGTVRDAASKPVPEAFVVAHRPDMCFDLVTAYTDSQGRYRMQGLGDGQFLVHVDAVHRGYVRTRTPIEIARTAKSSRLDFTLLRGATISGKFVDEKGYNWPIAQSQGRAFIKARENNFALTGIRNKYRPKDSQERSGGAFALGEGNYADGEMLFPTESTFIIQGMLPGHTTIQFSPLKEGQTTTKILHDGRDVLISGIDTKPGQEVKDVTVVIGNK